MKASAAEAVKAQAAQKQAEAVEEVLRRVKAIEARAGVSL